MTEAEALHTLREILGAEFELTPESVRAEARLQEDLDLDSLDAVVLAVRLEERTGLVIDDDLVASIRTVRDILDAILQQLPGRGA